MFETLKNLWRRKINPPSQENFPTAEPERGAVREGWRKNRKYRSRRDADAAYRQRKAAAKQTEPSEAVAPEITLPALRIAPPSIEESATVKQSKFLFSELRGLIHPGVSATRPAPPIVDVKPARAEAIPIAELEIFEVKATANESPKVAQPIEPSPASVEWEPDWMEESRVDLPMRTPEEIARLLRFETPSQTRARIQNDQARYLHSRRGTPAPDVQAAIINPNFEFPSVTTFVRR